MNIPNVRVVAPKTFHFYEPDKPCSYWSNGFHLVAERECRCGKVFELTEEIPEVQG